MDVRKIATRNAEVDRFGAGGEEQSAEALPAAVREPDFSGLGIDRDCAGAELQLDPMLAVEIGRPQRNPFLGRVAGQVVLGQIGSIIWSRVIGAQHRDRAGVALAPQHLGRSVSCRTAADDNDRIRPGTCCRPRPAFRRFKLVADIDFSVLLVDTPARDRVQRRGAQCRSGAQAEAGMVPGATDGIRHQHPLGEGAVVMGALRANCEERPASSRQHHGLARGLPQDHPALGEILERDPPGKVGSFEFLLLFAHRCLLLTDETLLHL